MTKISKYITKLGWLVWFGCAGPGFWDPVMWHPIFQGYCPLALGGLNPLLPDSWSSRLPGINMLTYSFLLFSGLLSRNSKESKRLLKVIIDLLCLGAQMTGFFIWPIVEIGEFLAILCLLKKPRFRKNYLTLSHRCSGIFFRGGRSV